MAPVTSEAAVVRPGWAAGVSGVHSSDMCGTPFGVSVSTADARWIEDNLRRASECGVRVYFNFGRQNMTTDGSKDGRFSITRAKGYVDRLAQLNPVFKRYTENGTLIGLQTLDDMGCKPCWGGIGVTQQQTETLRLQVTDKFKDDFTVWCVVHFNGMKGVLKLKP